MNNKYFILALTSFVIVVSCNKERDRAVVQSNPPQSPQNGGFVFSSETGEATKVGLASDNSLYWTGGDQIAVYSYNGDDAVCRDVATLFSGEGSSTGRFAPETYSDNSSWYDPDALSQDYDFYAWYPAASAATPNSKVISVSNVSPVQTETVGFGDYLVCWAKTETDKSNLVAGSAPNFLFAPKSALLKFIVNNSSKTAITINSIRLDANANISGDAELNLATGILSAGSRNDVTYYPASPIVVSAGSKTWVPVNISLLPCAATSIAVSLGNCNVECQEDLTLSGIESGRVYSKEAVFISPTPKRTVDILNETAQTASSSSLETNKLYYGKANCLVMSKYATQGTLNIQLFASSDGFARSDLASSYTSAVTSAKVIWAETALYNDANFGIIGANLNTLTISKSNGVTGNALVGIYDANDELLWSYHIWCPSDVTTYLNFRSEQNTKFASVYKLALGQVAGEQTDGYLYYQWGRKDPLGRASTLSSTNNSLVEITGASFTSVANTDTGEEINNLAYARNNPTEYIKSSDTPYDWFPAKATMTSHIYLEDRLWSTTDATIYDPCPEGYHVAPITLWEGTTSKSSGNFSAGSTTKLWYVCGGEFSVTGTNPTPHAANMGSYGYYWSSNVYGNHARRLYFSKNTNLYRDHNYHRDDALGVRCVKN